MAINTGNVTRSGVTEQVGGACQPVRSLHSILGRQVLRSLSQMLRGRMQLLLLQLTRAMLPLLS